VLSANFRRSAEALRSLEEYAKLDDVWLASRFEVLRYDLYTLEKLVLTAAQAHRALGDARLYLLVGGLPTLGDLRWLVSEALAGGVQVVQLREKGLDDRTVLARARELRRLTREAGAWLILNDRPDLARLCGADGVHVGQDDLPAPLARRVLGPRGLVGVSTHDPGQLDRAVRDGASYLGVGPVYPGGTKEFEAYAGLELVRQAASATSLPWFAIGGIERGNLPDVIEAGARRVAVSGAILRAERPRAEAAALRALLDAAG
jgi:thiamine-phosphate pyrophosphorylase